MFYSRKLCVKLTVNLHVVPKLNTNFSNARINVKRVSQYAYDFANVYDVQHSSQSLRWVVRLLKFLVIVAHFQWVCFISSQESVIIKGRPSSFADSALYTLSRQFDCT